MKACEELTDEFKSNNAKVLSDHSKWIKLRAKHWIWSYSGLESYPSHFDLPCYGEQSLSWWISWSLTNITSSLTLQHFYSGMLVPNILGFYSASLLLSALTLHFIHSYREFQDGFVLLSVQTGYHLRNKFADSPPSVGIWNLNVRTWTSADLAIISIFFTNVSVRVAVELILFNWTNITAYDKIATPFLLGHAGND